MRGALDVVAGLGRAPAQLAAEADAPDELHERGVGRQDHVIEAVPGEGTEVVPGGEPARLLRPLIDGHAVAGGPEPLGERETHETPADDADAHRPQSVAPRASARGAPRNGAALPGDRSLEALVDADPGAHAEQALAERDVRHAPHHVLVLAAG